jgi:dihydroxyacetone kinase
VTPISQATLKNAVRAAHRGIAELEQKLNAADSRLGDGDTGSMLARVIAKLDEVDLDAAPDLGAAFSLFARAAVSATGSSLGTLFATALMTLSMETRGRRTVDWTELGGLLAKACDAMIARGGAKLGDKTVLDALHAVAKTIDGCDQVEIPMLTHQAIRETMDRFRGLPCQIGRARMFGDNSIGFDDPGMLAIAELSACLTG